MGFGPHRLAVDPALPLARVARCTLMRSGEIRAFLLSLSAEAFWNGEANYPTGYWKMTKAVRNGSLWEVRASCWPCREAADEMEHDSPMYLAVTVSHENVERGLLEDPEKVKREFIATISRKFTVAIWTVVMEAKMSFTLPSEASKSVPS